MDRQAQLCDLDLINALKHLPTISGHQRGPVGGQARSAWEPVGGEERCANFFTGAGVVNSIDRGHMHLADCTMGVVGVGAIGSQVARRAKLFGMTVLGIDPQQTSVPGAVDEVWSPERLPELLAASDFVVIAAPHTPQPGETGRRKCLTKSGKRITKKMGGIFPWGTFKLSGVLRLIGSLFFPSMENVACIRHGLVAADSHWLSYWW